MGTESPRDRLLHLIATRCFQYDEEPVFRLASGSLSNFYFNLKKISLNPEGMHLIGKLLFERVKGLNIKGAGGLTLGADPLAYALAHTSFLEGQPIEAFVVRKELKGHGVSSGIDGNVSPGDRVAVLDDVVTTGGSTLKAVARAKEYGLEVVAAVMLVDREEMDGMANIQREVPEAFALFTRSEVMAFLGKEEG